MGITYLMGTRALGVLLHTRKDNIETELEEIVCATVVWTEIDLIKTVSYRRVNQP
jgi:hypothetical protein